MTYKALYREWRPLTFDDMVEQKHVVQTLKNTVITGRIGHAYLFCGTRGTGKTSCAHIMARAVNCLDPREGNPCNRCRVCTGISTGTISDVLEIDAASNNSVNNIRELREEVQYLPVAAKYKVYIIDEVHMLSTGAFNALLKTLEEPPSHAIFILATTEPHKLPATILSRCQRFDFRQISLDGITMRLRQILQDKDTIVTDGALRVIARKADGALRDAVSLLDQCLASGEKNIDSGHVIDMLGTVNDSDMIELCRLVITYDIGGLFRLTEEIIAGGKKVSILLDDLILYFRHLLVLMTVDTPDDMLGLAEETIARLKDLSKGATPERVVYIIAELSKLENQMKWASLPRTLFEAGLVGICLGQPITEMDDNINDRLKNLEAKVDHLTMLGHLGSYSFAKNNDGSSPDEPDDSLLIELHEPENETAPATIEKTSEFFATGDVNPPFQGSDTPRQQDQPRKKVTVWKECLNDIYEEKKPLYFCLQNTNAVLDNDCILICDINENGYVKIQLSREEHMDMIHRVLCKRMGANNVKIKFSYRDNKQNLSSSQKIEELKKMSEKLDIPFSLE